MKRKHKLLVEITFDEMVSGDVAKSFIRNLLFVKDDSITKYQVKSYNRHIAAENIRKPATISRPTLSKLVDNVNSFKVLIDKKGNIILEPKQ